MIEHGWSPEEWLDIVADVKKPKKITYGEYQDLIDGYKERLKALEAA